MELFERKETLSAEHPARLGRLEKEQDALLDYLLSVPPAHIPGYKIDRLMEIEKEIENLINT